MILKNINFKNYKSFGNSDEGRLANLAPINIIFGNNSSGKSNVLKFLNLLFSKKMLKETIEVEGIVKTREIDSAFYEGTISNEPYIFHKNHRNIPITFDIQIQITKEDLIQRGYTEDNPFLSTFYKKNNPGVVNFVGAITSSADPYTSTIKLTKVSFNTTDIYVDTGTNREYFKGLKELDGESHIFINFINLFTDCVFFLDKDRYLISENEILNKTDLFPHTFKNWLHNLSLDGINYDRFENFISFVKKYGQIDVFTNFSPTFSKEPNAKIEIFVSNGFERLPLSSFGTGVQQLLLILALIFETESKIILIEELELNFSPKSQQLLLLILTNLLNEKYIDQIILTSHSEVIANTPNIDAYEVKMEGGISSITSTPLTEQGNRDTAFFDREVAYDQLMITTYKSQPLGDEWE